MLLNEGNIISFLYIFISITCFTSLSCCNPINVVTRDHVVHKIVKDSIDEKSICVSKTHSRGKAVKM